MDEDVLRLQIPVHNPLFDQLHEPIADLRKHVYGLLLRYLPLLLHQLPELAPIAELLDDIVAVFALHDVQKSHNIGRFQGF